MKIGPGVSELWGVENRPLPFTKAHGLYNSLYYRTSRDFVYTLPERIQFKIAVLSANIQSSPWWRTTVMGPFNSNADVPGRRALRSAGTKRLVVPPVRLSTVVSRAFPVASAQICNSLPEHILQALMLQSFRRHLKSFLLQNLSVYSTLVYLVVISVT